MSSHSKGETELVSKKPEETNQNFKRVDKRKNQEDEVNKERERCRLGSSG